MFSWFKKISSPSPKADRMSLEFGQMLDAGRNTFLTASNALLGGTDPDVIREDLFATDRRINKSEQQIRRELVVHATVHGPATLPDALTLMSIVKDAERIGDYSKNIFDVCVIAEPLKRDEIHKDLVALKDIIADLLRDTRKVFDSQEEAAARELSHRMIDVEDHCDAKVADLLKRQAELSQPATQVLCYRYFKRVVSHAMNIISSIFMPLDKLDYFDEQPRPKFPPVGKPPED